MERPATAARVRSIPGTTAALQRMDRFTASRTLIAVIDTGSFSAAARQLGIGQPAVSKSIALLEQMLETRLFSRSTRGLSPTDAAHAYYAHAVQALAQLDEAEDAARGEDAALRGRLRVGVPVTFSSLHVIPRLAPFLARHPGLHIELLQDDRPVDLLAAGADLALRLGPLPDSSMTARRLAQGPQHLLASSTYLDAHGAPLTLDDLAAHRCIVYARGRAPQRVELLGDAQTRTLELRGSLSVSAAEGVRAAVLADLGIALASAWMFAPELADGTVRPVLTDWRLPPVDLWAVYPPGRQPGRKARAFAAWIEGQLAPAD